MKKLKGMKLILFFLSLAVPFFLPALDTEPGKSPLKIPETASKIKIDGILEEEEWKGALALTLNYEVDPGENIAPPVKTEVFLAYGAKYLYVGFKAYDPEPQQIRARVTDRDNIWNDDYVGIILDTFNDSRLTHNLYCNPYGIQADQVFTITQGTTSWDAIWDSAGRITENGYCVEMAIPFTSLRFQGKKQDQVWGIDLIRSYPRSLPHLIGLFPRDRSNNCYMCQAEKIIGFRNARPGRNLEFDPTFSGILTQEREDFPDGKFAKKNSEIEPGLTARWSFTPNLALNAAVNPDFSQVEADAAQLDINTQFALYYPEQRPFFLEGNSIFESRFYAIYTRTVVDPEWGVKLTGKEGKHAVGFFTARDKITNFIIPSSQSSWWLSMDMKNLSTALRYRYDLSKSSNIGIVATDREGNDYYNRIAGIDGDIRFTKKDRFWFQYIASQTRYPEEIVNNYNQPHNRFSGGAFDFYYVHSTRNVYLWGHYQDVSPNFRADVGFVDQTGTKLFDIGGSHIWRQNPGHWYTTLIAGNQYLYMKDYNDQLLQKYYRCWINYIGPLQSYFFVVTNFGKFAYGGQEFQDNFLNFDARIRPSGSLYLLINGSFGDRIDFSNVRAGTRVMLNPSIEYNLGRHIYLKLDHVFERLNVDAGRLYTANLSNLRLVYQIDRRAFLRTILQYANYQYNPELYTFPVNPEFKHLFSQVLFSYKINPQTVLFLGYSDDYYGYIGIPLTQNNRTFFLKIGYALVL